MVFGVAAAGVLVLSRIGLPSVVGFLLAGALVGPGGLGMVGDPHHVRFFAEIGVVLLLFTIGMEFSLARLARTWRHVVVGGGLQVLLTVGAAVGAAAIVGATARQGVFWGYLAALSSTAIVLRALRDRQEIDAPHGRLIVGVLIFQDLCVVPMMTTLPMLSTGTGDLGHLAVALGKAALLVVGILLLARRAVPTLLARIVALRQRETFLLAIIGIAVAVALATASMGLSLALGGFLAGVLLADSEYVWQAQSEVTPLRDALASLFFVSVGMLLEPAAIAASPWRVLALFALLLVGKTVLATLAGLMMRFPARVALQTGFGLAQVGEFSFVLLSEGRNLNLVGPDLARDFLAASVLTMIVTPLLLAASPRLAAGARLLRPVERIFAVRTPPAEERRDARRLRDHVIVAGLGIAGQMLVRAMEVARVPYIAVELNPEVVIQQRKLGRHVRFGDASSPEVLEHAGHASHARLLVLVMTDVETTLRVATLARTRWPRLRILARVRRSGADEARLRELGCEVIVEEIEGALDVVERVLRRRTDVVGEGIRGVLESAATGTPTAGAEATALLEEVVLEPLTVERGDRLAGVSIAESRMRTSTPATIAAVSRDGRVTMNPPAAMVLIHGDVALLIGTRAQVDHAKAWVKRRDGAPAYA